MLDFDTDFFNNNNGYVHIPRTELFIQTKLSFIQNSEYDVYQKMIYMLLHTYGIDYRGVYPTHLRIATQLKISKRKVITVLNELEDVGGIYIVNRKYKGTNQKISNLYYLAEISKDGFFIRESLDIVKERYPDKVVELDKPY